MARTGRLIEAVVVSLTDRCVQHLLQADYSILGRVRRVSKARLETTSLSLLACLWRWLKSM